MEMEGCSNGRKLTRLATIHSSNKDVEREQLTRGRLELGYREFDTRLTSLVRLYIASFMERLNFNTVNDMISLPEVLNEFLSFPPSLGRQKLLDSHF